MPFFPLMYHEQCTTLYDLFVYCDLLLAALVTLPQCILVAKRVSGSELLDMKVLSYATVELGITVPVKIPGIYCFLFQEIISRKINLLGMLCYFAQI